MIVRTAPQGQLEATVETWIRDHFLARSPVALRYGVRAARLPLRRALQEDLPQLERMYLDELMAESDAVEGLRAFMEKREPRWEQERSARVNPELEQILSRAQTLYEDVDYKAVAEWKSCAPGRRAIGYMPIYVPRELIHAAGMLPVGIFGGGDRLEIIRGDAYFQSYICHIPR